MTICSIQRYRKDIWKEFIVKTFKEKHEFLFKIILASFITAIALEKNNLEAVIGSTLVAPLGSIIVTFSIALLSSQKKYINYSVELLVSACIMIICTGFCVGKYFENTEPTKEMIKRHEKPDKYTFIIAFIIGLSYAYVIFTTESIDDGIGAGIAITLLPPIVNIGITFMKKNISKEDKLNYVRNSLLTSLYTFLGVFVACIGVFNYYCIL